MSSERTRNFCIIAHVDHGKSTLADRMLEATGTVPMRRMRAQYLDQLELERERGITIKMAPVRMVYRPAEIPNNKSQIANKSKDPNSKSLTFGTWDSGFSNSEYILNLIDTPGHSDFSYEVSRALQAVEGAVLLVDATKGVQAQTLSNLRAAERAGLTIVGAVNKVDLDPPRLNESVETLADLLGVSREEILKISGKTGEGVGELLRALIHRIPPPAKTSGIPRALIFDSLYDDHKGILAFVRVMSGTFSAGDAARFLATETNARIKEVGWFVPELKSDTLLETGGMGYIATGIKEPRLIKIGDTIIAEQEGARTRGKTDLALPGYKEPSPVVFISFYPDGATKFDDLKKALERLRLTDAALTLEPDANEALGRGIKVGFLGQLHFEITASRLTREFDLSSFLTSFPSIAYRVLVGTEVRHISDAHEFPDNPTQVFQPMIRAEIVVPALYLNNVLGLKRIFELEVTETRTLRESVILVGTMPLMELIRDFDDQLKSVSQGYASFSYELTDEAEAEVEKLEILVAGEVVPALTRIVFRKDSEREGRATVERLKDLLPRQQFAQAVQARVRGRIVARETIPALRKDVTGYLYGGDRSRKMKLWQKQKRGKEKLKGMSRVMISPEVFREILKK